MKLLWKAQAGINLGEYMFLIVIECDQGFNVIVKSHRPMCDNIWLLLRKIFTLT